MIQGEAEAREFVAARCDAAAMSRLALLVDALATENERQNLVSKGSLADVWMRHIADSAQLLDHVPRETLGTAPWLDLGTGAGFPGLVIAAMRPELPVIMVESRAKRVEWLERVARAMELDTARIEGCRLEVLDSFDAGVISARAFAPLKKLLALSARFSTSRTHWVLPKGRKAAQEVSELPKRLRDMFHVKQSQTDDEAGLILGTGQVSKA